MQTQSQTSTLNPRQILNLAHVMQTKTKPNSYKSTLQISHWHQAMLDEYNDLCNQQTWSLEPPPAHHQVLGSKWMYKTKFNVDDTVVRYKARLVMQGYTQKDGFN